jgi:hypothetical protein
MMPPQKRFEFQHSAKQDSASPRYRKYMLREHLGFHECVQESPDYLSSSDGEKASVSAPPGIPPAATAEQKHNE